MRTKGWLGEEKRERKGKGRGGEEGNPIGAVPLPLLPWLGVGSRAEVRVC